MRLAPIGVVALTIALGIPSPLTISRAHAAANDGHGQSESNSSTGKTPPRPRVTTSHRGVQVSITTRTSQKRRLHLLGRDGLERPADRMRRNVRAVAKRPLTLTEKAQILAVRRSQCLRAQRLAIAGATLAADRCSIVEPVTPTRPAIEQIKASIVLNEVRQLNFPSSLVHVQPRGITLVNLETNVYADPHRVDRAIPVLTWPVRIRATPASYIWHFGDGTTETTDNPGAPHPNATVTHKYLQRGKAAVSVTLNYDTWYQVPGGDWQRAGIVAIPGPATPIAVCEARPVLTDPDNDAPTDVDRTGNCSTPGGR
jgi:hypothetical protein